MDSMAPATLDDAVARAHARLLDEQKPDGHFVFELEADATIPAEFVLLTHFLDRPEPALEQAIGRYLRRIQAEHGGWPLFHDGRFDLSASVKAYFALKMIGDDPAAPHMARARAAILAAGGAARANVFTRAQLALYGEVPWRAVPVMPVEIMLLPRWFPFHLDRVSYWSRTVIVPLLVLMALRPRARNPRGITVQELFTTPPDRVTDWIRGPYRSTWGHVFKHVDRALRLVQPAFPRPARQRAIARAVAFVTKRLNGEDGLGGIYPAMANAMMMFDMLGYPQDHPDAAICWQALRKLLVIREGEAYCQPCLSPVWDTSLAGHAIAEAEGNTAPPVAAANAWLRARQVTETVGDWAAARPGVPPGGWAFQYENPHYPDVDDTAVVGMLLHRQGDPAHADAIARARAWIIGMQGRDGGWGAFDADNSHHYLNHIPFADHGALLDPSTADVTARCVSFLAQIGEAPDSPPIRRAIAWLKREQEPDGAWFGRWGTNYIYGTWSVLHALNGVGEDPSQPYIQKAVAWLKSTQREDGGWGEDCGNYWTERRNMPAKASTASQTAWAVLGLLAAGEVRSEAVARGVNFLMNAPREGGHWEEKWYTAVGFPRIFYLKYHGYSHYFPLWALARYRNLMSGNASTTPYGI